MRNFLLVAFISISGGLLNGCASINNAMGLPTNKGNGYIIKQERNIYGGGITIEYRDPAYLENEVRARMQNRMAPESELSSALAKISTGGEIFITYEALTVDAGNTKWLEYVILKKGAEIYRQKGSNSIPNVPKTSGPIRFWWNIDAVRVRVPLGEGFDLVVINNLQNKRDIFHISPK